MAKPQVGDIVRAYGVDFTTKGLVMGLTDSGMFEICDRKTLTIYLVHPKQCRKLVPKPKREIWATDTRFGLLVQTAKPDDGSPEKWVHYREVRAPKAKPGEGK